jgi:DNA polymerase III delta subunit
MEIKDNVEALLASFKKKKFHFLQICGDDFDVKESLSGIKENFSPEDIEIFFSDEGEEIIKSLSMKSLFGGKLIIVYDIDLIPSSLFKEIKKAVENPATLKPNFVVFAYRDQRKILKTRESLVAKFKSIYDSEIPLWIRSFVRRLGFSISREATSLLHFRCGTNREEIKKHIERIILLKEKEDKNIEEKDLENIGFYREDAIFKISNSIVDGKYNDALRYLLEYQGDVPVFHFVNRDIRYLLTIRAAIEEDETLEELKLNEKLNMHPYIFYNKYVPAAKRASYSALEDNFENIMDTEYRIKNGWVEFSLNFNFVGQLFNKEGINE